VLLAHLDVVVS
jgi:hypothetical protein